VTDEPTSDEPTPAESAEPTAAESAEPTEQETPDETTERPVGIYRNLPPVTERELAARARGLASAYIDGGEDPDIEETRRREAKYWRLLIGMIVIIVGGGLLVTFVGIIVAGNGG
jgi:hypothetical protein